jgi:hypothetical protein
MMVAVFAAMLAALVIGWFGRRDLALGCVALALALAGALFLWEIWSPEYGFRMPWIDVRLDAPGEVA